jgi:hypothetical protein
MLLARFGAPGSLAVDNYNNVVRIEDLLEGRNGKIK